MAGRGVDIKIDDGVRELGGLYVLGTERHEARRIDNQLRGRSGRQGDPGETRFYLSGQDDLVRLFAGDRIYNIMERFKLPDDQPMEAKILSNQIENAQKKVEEQNFVPRKNVLKYDDVMNVAAHGDLRAAPRGARGRGPLGGDQGAGSTRSIERVVDELHRSRVQRRAGTSTGSCRRWRRSTRRRASPPTSCARSVESRREALVDEFRDDARDDLRGAERRSRSSSAGLMRELERFIILQVVDQRWREHLENMDYLREGIHLRAMAQKDPLVEYRAEGHAMFEELNRVDPRGGRDAPLPRASSSRRRTADGLAAALAGSRTAAATAALVRARVARRRRRDRGRGAGGAGDRRVDRPAAPRRSHAARRLRAREARPQRPLLVRLGQEVQEVPRRVATLRAAEAQPA